MALLLAIDTSARTAGVALLDDDLVLAEQTWRATGNHTVQLLPVIERLVQGSGRQIADLDAIGVAVGPGAFSGLRVGLVTARALAWARAIPCLGVGSLDVLAAGAPWAPRLLTVLDAGRGDWYWATYGPERGVRRRLLGPQLAKPDDVLRGLTRSVTLVGDTTAEQRARISDQHGKLVEIVDPRLPALRPAALGLLAQRRLAAGERDDAASLQPVYIRRPAAEEHREAT